MRRKLLILLIAAAVIGAAAFWVLTIPESVPASALGTRTADLANGRTMFYAGGCAACHATPDQDDRTRLGGGLKINTAFGTFYAPNISPDAKNGIGAWSEADFVTALTKGTSPEGQHYYPVFPYGSYQNMTVTDARDLFAYLKTLPAVGDKSRAHALSFPFSVRRVVGGWKFLFLAGEQVRPDPSQPAARQRGAYLANGPGHCAECHSPRNALGGIVASQRFAGGPDPEGGEGSVPNITPAGIGEHSQRDIERILETGDMPNGDSVGGPMAAVVGNTSKLSAQDRAAIALYIKSLPPVEGPKRP